MRTLRWVRAEGGGGTLLSFCEERTLCSALAFASTALELRRIALVCTQVKGFKKPLGYAGGIVNKCENSVMRLASCCLFNLNQLVSQFYISLIILPKVMVTFLVSGPLIVYL